MGGTNIKYLFFCLPQPQLFGFFSHHLHPQKILILRLKMETRCRWKQGATLNACSKNVTFVITDLPMIKLYLCIDEFFIIILDYTCPKVPEHWCGLVPLGCTTQRGWRAEYWDLLQVSVRTALPSLENLLLPGSHETPCPTRSPGHLKQVCLSTAVLFL